MKKRGDSVPAEFKFLALVIGLIVIFLILILRRIKKGVSGLKLMLLGINITLVGGVVTLDNNLSLGVLGYFIVVVGLILSFIGSTKRD
jgi:uncharacterized membrane protein YadS